MSDLGYTNVRDYAGGISDWLEHGEPMESSTHRRRVRTDRNRQHGLSMAAPSHLGVGGHRARPGLGVGLIELLVLNRSISQLLGLWLLVVVGFGIIYWLAALAGADWLDGAAGPMGSTLEDLVTAIYFSFVTVLTIGYGDVSPMGFARILAIIEGAAGLLIFGFVISKLVSRRQEELITDIHAIAFEQRLGRVRTSLHLVLRELQAIVVLCDDATAPTARSRGLAESAAAVFEGELETIHDLLYRPEQMPDEQVLESILANVAACLEALEELLRCLPEESRRSPVLEKNLAKINTKAIQICADCVPHQYAPHLAEWMDRVQELAERIG